MKKKLLFTGIIFLVLWANSACTMVHIDSNKSPEIIQNTNVFSNASEIQWRNLPRFKCVSISGKTSIWVTTAEKWNILVSKNNLWNVLEGRKALCINFIDEKNGWLIDENYNLLSTNDSGDSWNLLTNNIDFSSARSLKFTDLSNGWIVDNYNVYRTSDGGRTWETILSYKEKYLHGQPGKLFALNNEMVWLCDEAGNSGWVYSSKNKGVNWFEKKITVNQGNPCDIFFLDSDNGWYSLGAKLFQTNNGGQNWKNLTSLPQNFEIRSMFWFNSNEGWLTGFYRQSDSSPMAGKGGVLFTSDGGKTWSDIKVNNSNPFFEYIYFIDSSTGWLIARDNIYYTSDGGKIWTLSLNLPLI